jgi:hypothetical protein
MPPKFNVNVTRGALAPMDEKNQPPNITFANTCAEILRFGGAGVQHSVCCRVWIFCPCTVSVCLSVYLPICLPICFVYISRQPINLTIYLSIYRSIYISYVCLFCLSIQSTYRTFDLAFYPFVHPSFSILPFLSIYLSIYASICLYVYLSVLSICFSIRLSKWSTSATRPAKSWS